MNIGGVPAVEELTLMLSVALGPRGFQDTAPRSWGPAWASTSQGPGGEGVGTSSRERSRTRTAQKTEDRPLGLSNDQTCLQERPSQGPQSPEEQGSACSSHSFAFVVLPLRTSLLSSHLASHPHRQRSASPGSVQPLPRSALW